MNVLAWQHAVASDDRISLIELGGADGIRFTFRGRPWAQPRLCTLWGDAFGLDLYIELPAGMRFLTAITYTAAADLRGVHAVRDPAGVIKLVGHVLSASRLYGWVASSAEHATQRRSFDWLHARGRYLYWGPNPSVWWRRALRAIAWPARRLLRGLS